MFRKGVFKGLSWDFSEIIGVQASKTALKIYYKSSLIYLGIRGIVIGIIAIKKSAPGSLANWLDNLSYNSWSREESKKVTEGQSL